MDAEQAQMVLAMMRHEYSRYPISQLRSEYERRVFAKDLNLFNNILTEGETWALFELLIAERSKK